MTIPGQFDDAPEASATEFPDQVYCEKAPLQWSDSESESEDDVSDEVYDNSDRVEDEDWEIAEQGTALPPSWD